MHPPADVHPLWFQIGISWWGALGVVIATVVLYLVYTGLMRLLGPRLMAAPSALSFTLVALFGAIAARAMMGNSPTLLGALIAIGTLLCMEVMMGRISDAVGRFRRHHGPRPVVVMVSGQVIEENLRKRHLTGGHLMDMLRRAGIHRLVDVELAILENRGTLTIVRAGDQVDDALLAGIEGEQLIPASLLRHGRRSGGDHRPGGVASSDAEQG